MRKITILKPHPPLNSFRQTGGVFSYIVKNLFLMGIGIGVLILWVQVKPDVSFGASSADPRCGVCHGGEGVPVQEKNRDECRICHGKEGESLPVAENGGSREVQKRRAQKASPSTVVVQEMVFIPPGPFLMGNNGRKSSEGAGNADERPLHEVELLEGYWMDRYETTNAMYEAFVKGAGHRIPKHWVDGSYPDALANHPVVYVDWGDSDSFCRWSRKRLPTEAEWEKAARGTDGRVFPWGNQFDIHRANTPQRWLSRGETGGTMPVGSFEEGKSPYGLYDMAGNVYEWTSSWYQPYPGNGVFNMHYGEVNKVLRGGSWYDCLSYGCGLSAPTYNRSRFTPKIRNKGFGFRCAKSGPG